MIPCRMILQRSVFGGSGNARWAVNYDTGEVHLSAINVQVFKHQKCVDSIFKSIHPDHVCAGGRFKSVRGLHYRSITLAAILLLCLLQQISGSLPPEQTAIPFQEFLIVAFSGSDMAV